MSEQRDWIGVVLAALGNHIRNLEDENAKLRYQIEAHEAFREFDRGAVRKLGDEIVEKLDTGERVDP